MVVGEPRAGRSDLIMGLRRALDPRSWSRTPDLADLHRPDPGTGADAADAETVVEVTLTGLGADLEQDLDNRLELIDPATGLARGRGAGRRRGAGRSRPVPDLLR